MLFLTSVLWIVLLTLVFPVSLFICKVFPLFTIISLTNGAAKPIGQGRQPTGQGYQPTAHNPYPSGQNQQPSGQRYRPTGQGNQPGGQGQQPIGQGNQPGGQGQQPSGQGGQPTNAKPGTNINFHLVNNIPLHNDVQNKNHRAQFSPTSLGLSPNFSTGFQGTNAGHSNKPSQQPGTYPGAALPISKG
jgi:hypothetical protein